MPLDPQAQAVLDQMEAMGLPPAHTVSPEEARINLNARPRSPGPEMAKVEDRLIPGDGPDIPVRIYTPHGSGPFLGMVWFHGGGWVVGKPGHRRRQRPPHGGGRGLRGGVGGLPAGSRGQVPCGSR